MISTVREVVRRITPVIAARIEGLWPEKRGTALYLRLRKWARELKIQELIHIYINELIYRSVVVITVISTVREVVRRITPIIAARIEGLWPEKRGTALYLRLRK